MSILDEIKDFFSNLVDILKNIWPILLIAVLMIWTMGFGTFMVWLGAALGSLSLWEVLGLALLLFFWADPEAATEVLTGAIEVVGDGVEILAESAGTALGGFVNTFADASGMSTFFVAAGLGLFAYYVITAEDDQQTASSKEVVGAN